MTLGRTSSGSIKIKTDGGLRAVNCACCSDDEILCDTNAFLDWPSATKEQFDEWRTSGPFTVNAHISTSTNTGESCSQSFSLQMAYSPTRCTDYQIETGSLCESWYYGYSTPSTIIARVGVSREVFSATSSRYNIVFDVDISCAVLLLGFFCEPIHVWTSYRPTDVYGDPPIGTVDFLGHTFNIFTNGSVDSFNISVT